MIIDSIIGEDAMLLECQSTQIGYGVHMLTGTVVHEGNTYLHADLGLVYRDGVDKGDTHTNMDGSYPHEQPLELSLDQYQALLRGDECKIDTQFIKE